VIVSEYTIYLSVRIDNLDILTEKHEEQPPQEDAASTAEAAPGRVGETSKVGRIEPTSYEVVEFISS